MEHKTKDLIVHFYGKPSIWTEGNRRDKPFKSYYAVKREVNKLGMASAAGYTT